MPKPAGGVLHSTEKLDELHLGWLRKDAVGEAGAAGHCSCTVLGVVLAVWPTQGGGGMPFGGPRGTDKAGSVTFVVKDELVNKLGVIEVRATGGVVAPSRPAKDVDLRGPPAAA